MSTNVLDAKHTEEMKIQFLFSNLVGKTTNQHDASMIKWWKY